MQQNTVGYLDLLRQNPNFRHLWFGQIVSLLGDWFNVIASATLVAILTGSGIAVGWLFVIQSLAPFLVSPIVGVMADRFNRKTILILSDILRGIVLFGFLFVRDVNDIWLLFTLIAIQFAISGFFYPTRDAMLPDIVSSDELGTANALSSATWSVMLAFGAAMGGLVAGWFGVYTAFVIDGLTFFLSAYFIFQVVYTPKQNMDEVPSASIRQVYEDYAQGVRYLSQHRDIFLIATQKIFVSMLLFSPIQVINVSLSKTTFVYGIDGSLGLGIMFAVIGFGTGLGPIG
ncbi:MAG: MFS transporter, partial [Chloroflexota bacterium]